MLKNIMINYTPRHSQGSGNVCEDTGMYIYVGNGVPGLFFKSFFLSSCGKQQHQLQMLGILNVLTVSMKIQSNEKRGGGLNDHIWGMCHFHPAFWGLLIWVERLQSTG